LDVPFIIVSATIGEEVAVDAMRAGAHDYVMKNNRARLLPAIERELREAQVRKDREQLEKELLQSQKMEAVGRLAGGVAHDFNNILTVILGYSELLLRDLHAADPLRRSAEEIRNSVERASALTKQILAFSRKQTQQPVVLNLSTVVREMERMLRRLIGEHMDLVIIAPNSLGNVKADPRQIEQVLLNLVVNARDAMPTGGTITVEIADVTLDEPYTRTHSGVAAGQYITLSVGDTGTGMTPEVKAHLFEPFFTTKSTGQGTGLGLATVYGIVKQSGGHITVESEVGRGSTFNIYLPRVLEAAPAAPQPEQCGDLPRGDEIVLVVEDEPAVRVLAARLLRGLGYHVLEAENGNDALRVATAHVGQPIDLLLSDVVMPQMGGKELTDLLRPIHPETKVLFASGYTGDALFCQGTLEPQFAFLQKPYTSAALAHKVRQVLDEPLPVAA
jgi:signal transduction histidine kinase